MNPTNPHIVQNDGGRSASGYVDQTGDCVTRAIAIVTGKSYQEVYEEIQARSLKERLGKRKKTRSNPRTGVHKPLWKKYCKDLGMTWVPTMLIGSGCKVHLKPEELPKGKLVVAVSKHLVAVIDGVIHDTHDCTRNGTRCVYGYFIYNK